MNNLAQTSEGILVSSDLLSQGLKIGDNLRVSVYDTEEYTTFDFKVVGVFDISPAGIPARCR